MTATARKTPAPKPATASVGSAAAAAVELPGAVTYLDRDWDPATLPIGHALAVELLAQEETASE